MVRDFHEKFGYSKSPAEPELREGDLRANLIAEEAAEVVVALVGSARAQAIVVGQLMKVVEKAVRARKDKPDLAEALKELCDLLYVTFGSMETFGLTYAEAMAVFAEVHRANMDKKPGNRDENGKTVKGEGWVPPDIEGLLRRIVESRIAVAEYGKCTCPTFCGGACF
jgi:predicted HAD superfamily Cof-like phosphohydrolase